MRIKGIVIKGKDKGRALGYPTANMEINGKLESGVYTGKVFLNGKEFIAGIFIHKNILEAHILNFSGDLYEEEIEVEIGEKIREVRKFENDEEVQRQIRRDLDIINIPSNKGGQGDF